MTKRDWRAFDFARTTAEAYIGRWYIWGGDDPSGFDCSGFVIEILKSAGLLPLRGDWTAAQLYELFKDKEVSGPDRGHLLFVERNRVIVHVEFCLDHRFTIGASGGNHKIRNMEDAVRENAFVKIRPIKGRFTGKLLYVDPFKIKLAGDPV